ncbi:GAF domain-containing sensor histidine kinase [Candidatus Daviesbacteria bacterium]|nr:GAF domain-containing sensor histidine kinase [Candidatus Daviesbacteria bacterium]
MLIGIIALTVLLLVVVLILKQLYQKFNKQVAKLSYQNRLLQALRHLDIAALSTTELEPICQQIVNAIRGELGYFFGAVALIDERLGGLRRIAISEDPRLKEVLRRLPIEYSKQVVPFDRKDNTLIQVITDQKSRYTDRLFDLQRGVFSPDISDNMQSTLSMKGFFVYPLVTKRRVLGIMYYCTTVPKEKFSSFEFDVMDEFSREVARVLDNALLYQDLKQTTGELSVANTRLKDLDKLKDDFVSVASHELRTPMTAIRSYAWMALNRSNVVLSPQLEKYLIRILISTERLINLVNDMLNISRIESGRIEINPEPVDMISLCRDIIDEVYYSKVSERNINFILLEERLPKVFADPEKFRQVLLNIVGNALKFSPKGGKITIGFLTDGKVVETYVQDEGPGISKEDLGRLFTKFGRLDNSYTATATSGGTGLGLYISKNLVELMHGKIWASSKGLGKGATFALCLPIASEEVIKNAEKFHIKPSGEVRGLEPVAI